MGLQKLRNIFTIIHPVIVKIVSLEFDLKEQNLVIKFQHRSCGNETGGKGAGHNL